MKLAGPIVAAAALTLFSACTLEGHAEAMGEDGIVALFPGDGAAAVPEDTGLRVELGWSTPASDDVIAWIGRTDGALDHADCVLDPELKVFDCLPEAPLRSDTTYIFAAQLQGRGNPVIRSTFQTAPPEGLGYEIGAELGVSELGSNALAGPALNAQLTASGPLLLVSEHLDAAEDLPHLGSNWVWGPGKRLEDQAGQPYVVRESVGYPFAAPTIVGEGGTIFGSAEYAYLPVALGGQWRHVRVDGLTMYGDLDPAHPDLAVENLTLEGYIEAPSLLRALADTEGAEATAIRALIDLDTDTDGDGRVDAAHVVLETRPMPIAIQSPH